MKKNANQFVEDLISAEENPQLLHMLSSQAELESWIADNYEFDEEELQAAFLNSKSKLENAIGLPLTDEQLIALSGGKKSLSSDAKANIGIGVGGAAAGVAVGATAASIFIAVFVIK